MRHRWPWGSQMTTIDKNALHEIASGFVRIETDPDETDHVFVGEVEVLNSVDDGLNKAGVQDFHGLLVVEVMKLLTVVLEDRKVSNHVGQ